MKIKILNRLRASDEYVSGQALCEELGVSRTAVWKIINQLKEEGYEIASVNNKGYRILSTPDIITADEVGSLLTTQWAGRELYFFDETDSTNIEAKRLAESGCSHGTAVIAEKQNHGKGRRGKGWSSPAKTGIWMSLILKPDIHAANASMLTLAAALSAARGIEEVTGGKTSIKWPNDILMNDKKVCGILTEMSAEMSTKMEYINHIVVGMGINVNVQEFPDELKDIATSLLIETGISHNRAALVAKILDAFEYYYGIFVKKQNLEDLMEEYNSKLINKGRHVKIIRRDEEQIGTALGIDKEGSLLVQHENGAIEPVISGEVSVRGLYGYV